MPTLQYLYTMYDDLMSEKIIRQAPGPKETYSLRISPSLQRAAAEKAQGLGVAKSVYLADLIARDTGWSESDEPISNRTSNT